MNRIKEFWDRIKKIKHIEVYLTVVFALIVVVIYLSSLGGGQKEASSDKINQNSSQSYSTSAEYVSWLENKLDSVLTSVKGVGSVNVVITLESGFGYEYAIEEQTISSSQGTTVQSKLVLVDGKPVVTKELYPAIKGIVVVAQGADDVSVRMDLLSAIQTVVEVDNSRITILSGK